MRILLTENKMEVEGTRAELMSGVIELLHEMYEKKIIKQEDMTKMCELALKTPEEIDELAKEKANVLKEKIKNLLEGNKK